MLESLKKKFQFRFKDRTYAANNLAAALEDFLGKEKDKVKNNNLIVFGIPRGGVIVADIAAAKLKSDLDIVIPRKLRIPHNEEAAFGAIMGDGTVYIDRIVRDLDISGDYIEREKDFQLHEIKRRSALYRNKEELHQSIENKINGRTIILVDDGAASGATVIAAARSIKNSFNPNNKLIIGLPVAPKETVELTH